MPHYALQFHADRLTRELTGILSCNPGFGQELFRLATQGKSHGKVVFFQPPFTYEFNGYPGLRYRSWVSIKEMEYGEIQEAEAREDMDKNKTYTRTFHERSIKIARSSTRGYISYEMRRGTEKLGESAFRTENFLSKKNSREAIRFVEDFIERLSRITDSLI